MIGGEPQDIVFTSGGTEVNGRLPLAGSCNERQKVAPLWYFFFFFKEKVMLGLAILQVSLTELANVYPISTGCLMSHNVTCKLTCITLLFQ